MTGSTLSKLPPQPPVKAGGLSWGNLKAKSQAKPVLPVVEVKKAMKLLKGVGKSVAAIELMAHGGFRIIASSSSQNTPKQPPNPFDEVL